jgi:hypothetical protein
MTRVSYPGVYVDEFAPAAAIHGVVTVAGGFLIGAATAIAAARLRQRCRRS